MLRFLVIFSFLFMIFSSCKKIVPDANIPAYLQVDSFNYVCDSAIDLSLSKSHKIENVWVYANNVFLGVYILPAKIPILKTGKVKIDLKPGIKQNGISNTRVAYPFYQSHTDTFNFISGQTIPVNAKTRYFSFIKIPFSEYFERNDLKLERLRSGNGVTINKTPFGSKDVFEGKTSGQIILQGSDTVCEIATKETFTLPIGGVDVYLELNYKANVAFEFGLISNSSTSTNQQLIFTFNPTYDANGNLSWNKTYIDMAPEVGFNSTAIDYKIYFKALKKESDNDVNIFLDNIKVVKAID